MIKSDHLKHILCINLLRRIVKLYRNQRRKLNICSNIQKKNENDKQNKRKIGNTIKYNKQ